MEEKLPSVRDSEPELFDMEVDESADSADNANETIVPSNVPLSNGVEHSKQKIIYLIEDSSESDLSTSSSSDDSDDDSSSGNNILQARNVNRSRTEENNHLDIVLNTIPKGSAVSAVSRQQSVGYTAKDTPRKRTQSNSHLDNHNYVKVRKTTLDNDDSSHVKIRKKKLFSKSVNKPNKFNKLSATSVLKKKSLGFARKSLKNSLKMIKERKIVPKKTLVSTQLKNNKGLLPGQKNKDTQRKHLLKAQLQTVKRPRGRPRKYENGTKPSSKGLPGDQVKGLSLPKLSSGNIASKKLLKNSKSYIKPAKNERIIEEVSETSESEECIVRDNERTDIEYPARFKIRAVNLAGDKEGPPSSSERVFQMPPELVQKWCTDKEKILQEKDSEDCTDWETDLFITFLQDDVSQVVTLSAWLEQAKQLLKSIKVDESLITKEWALQWCKKFGLKLKQIQKKKTEKIKKRGRPRKSYFGSFKLEVAKFAQTHTFNATATKYGVASRCVSSWVKEQEELKSKVDKGLDKEHYRRKANIIENRKHFKLEKEVLEWYKSFDTGKVAPRCYVIAKAQSLAKKLNIYTFKASCHWYATWMRLYVKGEANKKDERSKTVANDSTTCNSSEMTIHDDNVDRPETTAQNESSDVDVVNEEAPVELPNNDLGTPSSPIASVSSKAADSESVPHKSDDAVQHGINNVNNSEDGCASTSEVNINKDDVLGDNSSCPAVVNDIQVKVSETLHSEIDIRESTISEEAKIIATASRVSSIVNGSGDGEVLLAASKNTSQHSTSPNFTKRFTEKFKGLVVHCAYKNGVGKAVERYNVSEDLVKTWCWSGKYRRRSRPAVTSESSVVTSKCYVALERNPFIEKLKYLDKYYQELEDPIPQQSPTNETDVLERSSDESDGLEILSPKEPYEVVDQEDQPIGITNEINESTSGEENYSDPDYSDSCLNDEDSSSDFEVPIDRKILRDKPARARRTTKPSLLRSQTESENSERGNGKHVTITGTGALGGNGEDAGLPDEEFLDNYPRSFRKGERYTTNFKQAVVNFARTSTYLAAGKKFEVHHSSVADWAKEFSKQYKPPPQPPVNDGAGELFLQWMRDINSTNRVLTPKMVLREADRIVKLKGAADAAKSSWFYNWYKEKIERIRLLERDQIEDFMECIERNTRICFPPALKLEIAKYAERHTFTETAKAFQIRRGTVSDWSNRKVELRKLLKEGRLYTLPVRNNSQKVIAETELHKWYMETCSAGTVPKYSVVKKKSLEVFGKYGVMSECTFSRHWFSNFCQRNNVVLRNTEEDNGRILVWLLERLEQNQTVTHQELLHHAVQVIREKRPKFVGSAGWVIRFCKRYWNLLQQFPSIQQKLPHDLGMKVNDFRKHVKSLHEQFNFGYCSVGSMDEIPLQFLPSSRKSPSGKDLLMRSCGLKNCHAIVFLACLMDGGILPPLILLKKDGTYSGGNLVLYQDEVHIDTKIFKHWLNHIWLVHVPTPNVILLDCFQPHVSSKVQDFIQEFGITTAVIPGGCTSKLHPVAVGLRQQFEKIVKNLWQEKTTDILKSVVPSSQEILTLVNEAYSRLESQTELIRRSFVVTGVSATGEDQWLENSDYLNGARD